MNIFDLLNEKFVINKKIRLISLFAGYGSQALALKYLGVDFEDYKIVEWAVKSIQAYKDIHYPDDNTNYSFALDDGEVYQTLYELGISLDYNVPMKLNQIKKKGSDWARNVYNNIMATRNLVNICNVKGMDLHIEEQDKYQYLLTYSFPCQ